MSIKFRLVALVAFFLAVMLADVLAINQWIAGAKDTGKIINIAGRQRMLSQKMTKEVAFTLLGQDLSADFGKTKKLFDASLSGLINGSSAMGIGPAEDPEVAAQLRKVQNMWLAFEPRLSSLTQDVSDEELANIAQASLVLLKESNKAVTLLEQDANNEIETLRAIIWGFLALSVVAAVAALWYLNTHLIRRIDRIKRVSQEIVAEKDLTKRLAFCGRDEITSTAQAFDDMLDSFVAVNTEIRAVESELQQQLEILSITTQENKASMDAQRDEIMQVSTAINEMAATVQEVAKNTQEAAEVAGQTQSRAGHGSETLDSSMRLTHALARELVDASQNIQRLAEASESIGGIADTISTIAEQTNLLALNAAIEAARAGEQGRGFAVVADEVRTLAQRTQEATSEIHKLIDTLQDTTKASVEAMDNSRQRSEQGVGEAENLVQALTAIIESVQNLGDINHQIAVAAEQQSAVSDEINRNVLNIENKAENTLANAQATAEYSERLAAMAAQLRARLLEYKIA